MSRPSPIPIQPLSAWDGLFTRLVDRCSVGAGVSSAVATSGLPEADTEYTRLSSGGIATRRSLAAPRMRFAAHGICYHACLAEAAPYNTAVRPSLTTGHDASHVFRHQLHKASLHPNMSSKRTPAPRIRWRNAPNPRTPRNNLRFAWNDSAIHLSRSPSTGSTFCPFFVNMADWR